MISHEEGLSIQIDDIARECTSLHKFYETEFPAWNVEESVLINFLQVHENTRDRCEQVTGGKPARRGG